MVAPDFAMWDVSRRLFITGVFTLSFSAQANLYKSDIPLLIRAFTRYIAAKNFDRKKIDNKLSEQIFENFISELDPQHSVLSDSEVNTFRTQYSEELDDVLRTGNVQVIKSINKKFHL